MLKNILNVEGAQKLSKNEQKSINGGLLPIGCKQVWVDENDVTCGPSGYHFVMSGGKPYCCPN